MIWRRGLPLMIVILLTSWSAVPIAEAHCFTTWHYPWPQRCSAATSMRQLPPASASFRQPKRLESPEQTETTREQSGSDDKSWYVEFVLPTDRDRAIEELKDKLK
jgi:hypothetical protein